MNKKEKTEIETPPENKSPEELDSSFEKIWDKALVEIEDRKIDEALMLIKEERLEKEYIKKHGKEPEVRTPDGKINKKYIDYVLRRDFGIEPDTDYHRLYENFSWGGFTEEEALIAYWNCN